MTARDTLSGVRKIFYRPTVSRRSAIVFLSMAIIFVIALFMRIYPAFYGWYLNEFDPYFDYYASLHVVTLAQQHGLYYALFNKVNCSAFEGSNLNSTALTSALNCESQQGYFYWHTSQFWYPYGRNVAVTSQVGLQLTGAFTYLLINSVFRIPVSYYDWIVFFPVLFGSLTCITLYFLVKKITNSAGGILAALIFAVSPPILERGNLGWFKSEPLSLFLATIGAYFFLTIYNTKTTVKGMLIRGLIAGVFFGWADTAWGGGDEFILVFALIFLIAPFIKQIDMKRTAYGGSLVVAGFLLIDGLAPRPGISEISGVTGLALIFSWIFTFFAYYLRNFGDPTVYIRNVIKVLLVMIFAGLVFLAFSSSLLASVSGRYITVIDTFYRSSSPLEQSVAEQQIPTGANFFQYYAILIFVAGFGIYAAMRRKNIEALFALVLGITGVYIATSFSRLMVYSTLAMCVLAAIGVVEIAESILRPTTATISRKKTRIYEARSEIKVIFVVFMIIILALPMFYPTYASGYNLEHTGWFETANTPVSVANGATTFAATTPDWFEAFSYIQQTPANSTIMAWWDYGYWVAVMGNRTTLADNATSNSTQIALIGRALVSSPTTTMEILKDDLHEPTYILLFVAGSYLVEPANSQTGAPQTNYFFITVNTPYPNPPGGDESKKQWFIRIGNTSCNIPPQCASGGLVEDNGASNALMYPDDFTPTPYFWANSTMGQLMPFSNTEEYVYTPYLYGLTSSGPCSLQTTAQGYSGTACSTNGASGISDGYTEFLTYDMKYPASNSSAPFQLAFQSSSLSNAVSASSGSGTFTAVLIYKVNYNSAV